MISDLYCSILNDLNRITIMFVKITTKEKQYFLMTLTNSKNINSKISTQESITLYPFDQHYLYQKDLSFSFDTSFLLL